MVSLIGAPISLAHDQYSMDSIFLLGHEYRLRFLQHAARLLGCAYICIWSPFPDQSSKYASKNSFSPTLKPCEIYIEMMTYQLQPLVMHQCVASG